MVVLLNNHHPDSFNNYFDGPARRTALHVAAMCGDCAMIRQVLKLCPRLLSVVDGQNGSSALHSAVQSGNVDTVNLLVRRGIDVNQKNLDCLTPLQVLRYPQCV